jgi:AcrR family transcriptional regulator
MAKWFKEPLPLSERNGFVENAELRERVIVAASRARKARDPGRLRRFDRIKAAARELFHRDGYDQTTLRIVARKARVSAATIIKYFGDKRELLELLFDEEHDRVTEEALLELSDTKSFLKQSTDGFRPYYRYFGEHPEYARAILQLGTFYDPALAVSLASRPGAKAVARSIDRIKRTVEIARKRGEFTIDETDDALALLIFEIYQIECRHWLAAARPDVEQGLAKLSRVLSILERGFTAKNKPSRK